MGFNYEPNLRFEYISGIHIYIVKGIVKVKCWLWKKGRCDKNRIKIRLLYYRWVQMALFSFCKMRSNCYYYARASCQYLKIKWIGGWMLVCRHGVKHYTNLSHWIQHDIIPSLSQVYIIIIPTLYIEFRWSPLL